MSPSIVINEDACTGCEYCVKHLPEVFVMKPSGVSSVRDAGGAPLSRIDEVVRNCPAECIRLLD